VKSLLAVAVVLSLALASAHTQTEPVRIYTRPKPPPRDALDKLNLTLAWSHRLKTEGPRDGLFSVQLIPDKANPRMIVQLFSGVMIALDAENGDLLWRTPIGTPYYTAQPVGANSRYIFTTRRDELFVVDRDNGKQTLWSVQRDSNLPEYGFRLDGSPSAGLTADEEMVFICMDSRVSGYIVPDFRRMMQYRAKEEPESIPGGSKLKPSPQVRRLWTNVFPEDRFYQPPLDLGGDSIGLAAPNGTFVTVNRHDGVEGWRYQFEKGIVAHAAQHRAIAYIAGEDGYLYAFDTYRRKLAWRFARTAPIHRPIHATDRDIWVSPEGIGLCRVDRASGVARWRNRDAARFLAMNPRFVYATDRFGHLLVLDYDRGTALAQYDTRDFVVLVPNELTDRLYLAAHDGTLVCLHHREYPTPVRIKTLEPEDKGKPPPKKGKEKEKDEKLGVGSLRMEDRGSRIEGRESRVDVWVFDLRSSILDPRFSILGRRKRL